MKIKSKVAQADQPSLVLNVTCNIQSVFMFLILFYLFFFHNKNDWHKLQQHAAGQAVYRFLSNKEWSTPLVFKGLQTVWRKDAGVTEVTLSLEAGYRSVSLHMSWIRACTGNSVFSLLHSWAHVCCSTPIWQPNSLTYRYPLMIFSQFRWWLLWKKPLGRTELWRVCSPVVSGLHLCLLKVACFFGFFGLWPSMFTAIVFRWLWKQEQHFYVPFCGALLENSGLLPLDGEQVTVRGETSSSFVVSDSEKQKVQLHKQINHHWFWMSMVFPYIFNPSFFVDQFGFTFTTEIT